MVNSLVKKLVSLLPRKVWQEGRNSEGTKTELVYRVYASLCPPTQLFVVKLELKLGVE